MAYIQFAKEEKELFKLPFIHAVELERAVFHADYSNILPHLWWVLGYTVAAASAAVLLFLRQMKRQ